MTPDEYDAWYNTSKGRWIGRTEYRLLRRLLSPQLGDNLLDIGCGTGWFTRQLAEQAGVTVTGVDLDRNRIEFAKKQDKRSHYLRADALALPFADAYFDRSVSMMALCFIPDWRAAIQEMVRVTRTHFVIGVLNQHSRLWREKVPHGHAGAYEGAHWHTSEELAKAFDGLPVNNLHFYSAVFYPTGTLQARIMDQLLPNNLLWGSCLFVSGNLRT